MDRSNIEKCQTITMKTINCQNAVLSQTSLGNEICTKHLINDTSMQTFALKKNGDVCRLLSDQSHQLTSHDSLVGTVLSKVVSDHAYIKLLLVDKILNTFCEILQLLTRHDPKGKGKLELYSSNWGQSNWKEPSAFQSNGTVFNHWPLWA